MACSALTFRSEVRPDACLPSHKCWCQLLHAGFSHCVCQSGPHACLQGGRLLFLLPHEDSLAFSRTCVLFLGLLVISWRSYRIRPQPGHVCVPVICLVLKLDQQCGCTLVLPLPHHLCVCSSSATALLFSCGLC